MRYLVLLIVLFATPLFSGCSGENSQAVFEAHVATWYADHPGNIVYSTASYISECGNCHGLDLRGSGGSPSCFSATFTSNACHAAGPVPHTLDGTFGNADNHGPVAKRDLTVCQACHSSNPTGGPGTNPSFDVGIFGNGCEDCHGPGYAHPASWAGPSPNNRYHYSAGNVQQACTLCHGTALTSCNECHADAAVDFTLTCSSSSTRCHVMPPDGVNRIDHGTVADIGDHDVCLTCHGMKESATVGTFSNTANYGLFDKQTDTIGDHWDGNINMNSDTGYDQTQFGCTTAGCHGLAGHTLSDSGLPVVLGAYGVGAPHAVGQDWLLPSGHVASADASCVACHTLAGGGQDPACQDCHIQGDPLVVLNCTSCHSAPPSTASIDPLDRPDRQGAHDVTDSLTTSTQDCSACHQGGGTGTLTHYDLNSPADVVLASSFDSNSHGVATYDTLGRTCSGVNCHGGLITLDWLTGSLDVDTQCTSCHSQGTSEDNSYNSGEHSAHSGEACTDCHNTLNLVTNHFNNLENPAQWLDTAGETIGGGATSIGTYDDATNSCNLTCHGESRTW